MSLLLLFGPEGEAAPVVSVDIAYILNGITIPMPHHISEENGTQYVQHRVIEGDINRDFFGNNKRVWTLQYRNSKKTNYDVIKSIYDHYLTSGQFATWEIQGDNYSVSETNVHIELPERHFSTAGRSYISDYELTLLEV